jgi:hypothetical protein
MTTNLTWFGAEADAGSTAPTDFTFLLPGLEPLGVDDLSSVTDAYGSTFPSNQIDVLETASVGDELTPDSYAFVDDRTRARDSVFGSTTRVRDLDSTARVGDSHRLGLRLDEVETLQATDEVFTTAAIRVVDTSGINDLVATSAARTRDITEDARILDAAFVASGQDVIETAVITDAVEAATAVDVVELAYITAQVFDQGQAQPETNDLSVTAGVDDSVELQVQRNATLDSTAYITEHLFYEQPGAIAWVINTESTAVSWYTNWQFTDMAQVDGKTLAIGPEGLAVIGADTDAGTRVNAFVDWGYQDFGEQQKKRVDGFWFGYSAKLPMELTISTYGQGYGDFTYRMDTRRAEDGRNNRIKPGMGLNARYWRVKLKNIRGGDFDVYSMSADIAVSSRRM